MLSAGEMTVAELCAAVLSVCAVLLTMRMSVWCWPIWLAASALYAWVFFVSRFYADALLQCVFIVLEIKGWYAWSRTNPARIPALSVSKMTGREAGLHSMLILFLGFAGGFAFSRFTQATYPWLDSFCAALSISATLLQSKKKTENWLLLIAANILYVGMYATKGLYFTTVLYSIFLLMAVAGFREWRNALSKGSN